MDIWKESGISSKNTTKHSCFQKGYLKINTESGIIEKEFDYSVEAQENYTEFDGLVGSFTNKTKTIFTPAYWLPFQKGAKVRMASGEMQIRDVAVVQDNKKAQFDRMGIEGVLITF